MSTTNEFIRTLKTLHRKYFPWTTLVWVCVSFTCNIGRSSTNKSWCILQPTKIVCDRVVFVVLIHCFLLSNFISILCFPFSVEMLVHCGWHCHGKEISVRKLSYFESDKWKWTFLVFFLCLLSGHWRRAQVWHWHWCWVPTDPWLELQSVHRCCRRSSIV